MWCCGIARFTGSGITKAVPIPVPSAAGIPRNTSINLNYTEKEIIFKDMEMMAIYQLPIRKAFLIFIMFSVVGWI